MPSEDFIPRSAMAGYPCPWLWEREGADWPLARDPDGIFAAAYGVNRIPQTFFLDADGVLVSQVYGITSAADLEAEIRRILP